MPRRPHTEIADILRETRTSLRYTQKALGELVGVTARTVNRWEMGRAAPPLSERIKLVKVLAGAAGQPPAALAAALGVEGLVGAPRPSATAPSVAGVDAAAALDLALLALAEELDLSPRALPRALAAFLQRIDESGLGLEAARARLLARRPVPSHHVEGEP